MALVAYTRRFLIVEAERLGFVSVVALSAMFGSFFEVRREPFTFANFGHSASKDILEHVSYQKQAAEVCQLHILYVNETEGNRMKDMSDYIDCAGYRCLLPDSIRISEPNRTKLRRAFGMTPIHAS